MDRSVAKISALLCVFLLYGTLPSIQAEKHSLYYIYTALSKPVDLPGIYEFTAMGLLDDRQIDYYNSEEKRKIPKQQWMKEKMQEDYWEKGTQSRKSKEQWFNVNIRILMDRMRTNDSDVHVLQWRHGCEVEQQGDKVTFLKGISEYSYDGEEFLSFDIEESQWVAPVDAALPTKRKWDNVPILNQYTKGYLEKECVDWLNKFREYADEELRNGSPPKIHVFEKKNINDKTKLKLTCMATGFYPKDVMMIIRKYRTSLPVDEIKSTGITPNHDGSFQLRKSVEIKEEEKDEYDCFVSHKSMKQPVISKLGQAIESSNANAANAEEPLLEKESDGRECAGETPDISAIVSLEQAKQSEKHSLYYIYTVLSKPVDLPGIYEFTAMGLLDDRQIDSYNSEEKRKIPKQQWMKEKMQEDYWDKGTQSRKSKEQWFNLNVKILMHRMRTNDSDVHVLQWRHGCEVEQQGDEVKFLKGISEYGYDGEDFLSFDDKESQWVAPVYAALPTKRKWDNVPILNQYTKGYLEKECVDWLNKFREYADEELRNGSPPKVHVFEKKNTNDKTKLKLTCMATGFYPKDVMLTIMKNCRPLSEDEPKSTGIRPNHDGSFQLRKSVEIKEEKKDEYACFVSHKSMKQPVIAKLGQAIESSNANAANAEEPLLEKESDGRECAGETPDISAIVSLEQAKQSEKHSLYYIYTVLSKPVDLPGIYEFTAMGLLDDRQIDSYNSEEKRKIPKQQWMKEKMQEDYWDKGTQSRKSKEQWFNLNVKILMHRMRTNDSDVHVLQWRHGCEVEQQGDEVKFLKGISEYGYDGEDFLSFDDKESQWVAPVYAALPTKRKWDNVPILNQYTKGYLEKECVDWLNKFREYADEELRNGSPPKVHVFEKKNTNDKTKLKLTCMATGFYPKDVMLTIMKNCRPLSEDEPKSTGIRPNHDGSFQLRKSVEIKEEKKEEYACFVSHKSMKQPVIAKLGQAIESSNANAANAEEPLLEKESDGRECAGETPDISAIVSLEQAKQSEKHSLYYIYTALSKPVDLPGIYEFTAMGLLDDRQIDSYNSEEKRKIPKQQWMKEKMQEDYWEKGTQSRKSKEQWFNVNVRILMDRMRTNDSDVHVLQWRHGCEVEQQGDEVKFLKGISEYGYDGEDFLAFDDKESQWVAPVYAALPTKRKWDNVPILNQYTKGYLEKECVDWLNKFREYADEELRNGSPPKVHVFEKKNTNDKTKLKLTCMATGFYPKDVMLTIMKNCRPLSEDEPKSTGIRPNHDGSFQLRKSVEIKEEKKDEYACFVSHKSMKQPVIAKLGQAIESSNANAANAEEPLLEKESDGRECAGETPDISAIVSLEQAKQSEKHSLYYIYTALSKPVDLPGIYEFTAMGLLDDRQIDSYNSEEKRKIPKQPWMKEKMQEDYWDKGTQSRKSKEQWFNVNIKILMDRMRTNDSDVHVLQWRHGCEVEQQGDKVKFLKGISEYGYDGEDFLFFDDKEFQWVAPVDAALPTKRKWDNVPILTQYTKGYLEKECVDWLNKFREYADEELRNGSPPKVHVFEKKNINDKTKLKLTCMATGFYPKDVMLTVRKNCRPLSEDETTGIRPNHDGSFQLRKSVEIKEEKKAEYDCLVSHRTLKEPIIIKWDGQ